MRDMLRETPAFQDIIREGIEEGKGIGQLEAFRQGLMHVVAARFPKLVQLAKERIAMIDNPDELDGLLVKISISQNTKEARGYLLNEQEDDDIN